MASLFPGFEYDVFISYRHNDNIYDGWVTEFVENLKRELVATLKDPVSIYFDSNPNDGLLDTHNINKSLEGKLKCLIFIPIVSQTYCDPKSFAWHSEFCVFNKTVIGDQFGRDIRLANGNVSSRILPVKIHVLDAIDEALLETEIGGPLRAIDFIYREVGVNRPLKSTDNKNDNQNRTDYRNQVNKVANALKEIITGIKYFESPIQPSSKIVEAQRNKGTVMDAKSIGVLPFVNMSSDPEQEYFSDGLTEEIITKLSRLGKLIVISRSSMMSFKGTNKKCAEIASEVNVEYLLEGSVRKSGNNLRITAQLIDAADDSHLWVKNYNGNVADIFKIQESVARSIVKALDVKLTTKEDIHLSTRSIQNVQAYECYIRARQELWKLTENGLTKAITQLERGLEFSGENATLFATLATAYSYFHQFGLKVTEEVLIKARQNAMRSLFIDAECSQAHVVIGILSYTNGRLQEAAKTFKKALSFDSTNTDALLWVSITYFISGKPDAARPHSKKLLQIDPLTPVSQALPGWIEFNSNNIEIAIPFYEKWLQLDPDGPFCRWCCAMLYSYGNNLALCITVLDSIIKDFPDLVFSKHALFYKSALQGDRAGALGYATKELRNLASTNVYLPPLMAVGFALIDEKDEAIFWLSKAFQNGYTNYPFLMADPFLKTLTGYPAYTILMAEIKEGWQKFQT